MKKILILAFLFIIASCYKVRVNDTGLKPGFFQDEYYICDTVVCNMTCSVFSDSAKIQFLKRTFVTKDTYIVNFKDEEYLIRKDSVLILREDYKYTSLGFRQMLIDKSKTLRNGEGFYFSPNVGLTWYTFDKIFNTYIND